MGKKFIKNKKLKYLFIFVSFFVLTFIPLYVIFAPFCDDIWSYGFSYNISKGMVIYRDFNVLQTPLYFFICSVFIKIFGNHIIALGILNSILVGFMAVILYKMQKSKLLFLLVLILIFGVSGYNILLTFLCLLILYLVSEKKDNDVLIGFIVGLMFLTKQNMGVIMLIPCLYYSKKKYKSMCAFLLPILVLLIYLIYNSALYSFIDYAFLGLFSFGENNTDFIIGLLIIEIIGCIYLVRNLIKSRFKDKLVFYVLAFQFMSYPICDGNHFSFSIFIFLCYYILRVDNLNLIFKVLSNSFQIGLLLSYIIIYMFEPLQDLNIVYDKDSLFYLKNESDLMLDINNIYNYLEKHDYDSYYITNTYAYLFKLYYEIPINEYDFLMDGNMGYDNGKSLFLELEDNCKMKKCMFFVDKYSKLNSGQWRNTALWIIDRYKKIDDLGKFEVYSNEDMLEE